MTSLSGKRVLIVDDEPFIRYTVADELEHAGWLVVEAADGAEAIDVLETGDAIDLMVTDIRMPGFDGWTLAERARELRPGLPILYVSGFSGVDPRPVPGGEFLPKPFLPAQLRAAAAKLVR
jgi:CheY-like chemotaxis protein